MQLIVNNIKDLLDMSLKEDLGTIGDITSQYIFSTKNTDNLVKKFQIKTKEFVILSGIDIATYYLNNYTNANYKINFHDKDQLKAGDVILEGECNIKDLLMLERVILNFMQNLSSVATNSFIFTNKLAKYNCKIADTRKTTPLYRSLHKYAAYCGGVSIHRPTIDAAIMIKDNHIKANNNDILDTINKVVDKVPHYMKIEVECDNLEQVKIASNQKIDIILLDNMDIKTITKAVEIIRNNNKNIIIEVSGGVNIDNIEDIAKTNIDIISTSSLTNSYKMIDLSLDII